MKNYVHYKYRKKISAKSLEDNHICDALRDLVPFVQFKKREKHPWRSVNFSKIAGFRRGLGTSTKIQELKYVN